MQNTLSRDETAEVILTLTRQALAAPDVPSAVGPLLEAFVQRTAADGGAFFQVDGSVFHARAVQGDMPTGPAMESILTHGLPGDTPLLRALTTGDAPIIVDDTSRSPETAGFPALGVASLAAVPVLDRQGCCWAPSSRALSRRTRGPKVNPPSSPRRSARSPG